MYRFEKKKNNKIFAGRGGVMINNSADFYHGYKMQMDLSIINRKQMNSNGGNWQYHFIINLTLFPIP